MTRPEEGAYHQDGEHCDYCDEDLDVAQICEYSPRADGYTGTPRGRRGALGPCKRRCSRTPSRVPLLPFWMSREGGALLYPAGVHDSRLVGGCPPRAECRRPGFCQPRGTPRVTRFMS